MVGVRTWKIVAEIDVVLVMCGSPNTKQNINIAIRMNAWELRDLKRRKRPIYLKNITQMEKGLGEKERKGKQCVKWHILHHSKLDPISLPPNSISPFHISNCLLQPHPFFSHYNSLIFHIKKENFVKDNIWSENKITERKQMFQSCK